jgi:dTMP kinase
MSENALFVTFEGGEGAGKTTLIKSLEEALTEMGYEVMITREPGGSSLGEKIRQLLLNQPGSISITSMAELMLFLADRSQHIEEVIKPALQQGKIVLCDRFNDSTIAYQGVGRGLGFEKVQKMCHLVAADTIPDRTFFLDVDPQVGLERAKKQRAQDRIEKEKEAFHEKVRQGFLALAKQESQRIIVLNALESPESVFKKALKHLEAQL